MRRGVKALEASNPGDQLAWFILRLIAVLSPCTEKSFIAYVSGGDPASGPGHTSSASFKQKLIGNALLKLKELDFIQFTDQQIAVTDEGRRFLDESPVAALPQHENRSETSETITDNKITTEFREPDFMESTAEVKETHPWVPSMPKLGTRPWRHATTWLAEYTPRLKQFCQDRLAEAREATQRGFKMNGVWVRGIALKVWELKAAAMIRSGATNLVNMLKQVAMGCRIHAKSCAIVLGNSPKQIRALLSKAAKASGLPENVKLAGFDLSQSVILASALLLVCGTLAIACGVAFLSDKRVDSSRAEAVAFLSDKRVDSSRAGAVGFASGDRAENPRESPIVWLFDGQDRPGRSIFVTRKLAGATWIEGFAIRGENASNQKLTAVQAAIKTDSGEEIKLSVSMAESQGKQVDAQVVPPGSQFTLESAFQPDASGQQTAMPAGDFLSKYGGMIFRFSYTVAGAQRTSIEYFSTSKLKAQLADIESAERDQ